LGKNARMANLQIDPRWPRLLSLAVHELRTPITVTAGYLRMVTREKVGPISDQQRKLLEEAEKACGRLSALVAEMSDLSALEAGSAPLNKASMDLSAALKHAAAELAEMQDREVAVEVHGADSPITITGDAKRLKGAFASLFAALRREVVTSDRLVVRMTRNTPGTCVISIAGADQIESVAAAHPASLDLFDEWRGGSGLSLAIARRVIGQHGGTLFGLPGGEKAAAVVELPCT
jgi:signal transduction histidine kinase